MSAFEPKRKRERAADVTGWVLGTIIVLLATLIFFAALAAKRLRRLSAPVS